MVSLLLRNLLFMILQPGLVAGVVPYLLLRGFGAFVPQVWSASHFVGLTIAVIGFAVLMYCVWIFPFLGQGTISPLDPTQKLVTTGIYQYSRNPMYIGAVVLLIGEAIFYRSPLLAGYTCLIFLAFNLFIIFHEEPRLKRAFGDQYDEYRQQVRRWS